jgi:putative ABC transport system substrate-binding protein
MCGDDRYAKAGGLMNHSANVADMVRQVAGHVDRLLREANPAELPVEQPTKFEFDTNLKTAKALGLTIPPSLLLRADRIIE